MARASIPAGEADEMANAGASSITARMPEDDDLVGRANSHTRSAQILRATGGGYGCENGHINGATSGPSLAPVDAEIEDQPERRRKKCCYIWIRDRSDG